MTKTEYEKLNESEKDRTSDDGRINVYACTYGHWTVTKDSHFGVTPMMLQCEPCWDLARRKVWASSKMYQVPQDLTPTHEFYRPSYEYFQSIKSEALKNHIERGGLAFRKIGDLECYQ